MSGLLPLDGRGQGLDQAFELLSQVPVYLRYLRALLVCICSIK